jgi:serine protease
VLDTGITDHPDLAGVHRVPGYDFVAGGNGVLPADGDGWDPDPSDPGDACALGADRTPSSWHGTFVTGEIAAQQGHGGVAGEAPGVTIEPVRVLGACGGAESDLIAAIEWASGGDVPSVPHNDHPAQVISLSLGAAGPCDAALRQTVSDAWARGVTVVTAAGNEDVAVSGTAPADCPHVISVAASSRAGNRAAYSNFGTAALSPTLAGPGGSGNDPVWGDGWTSTGSIGATGNRPAIVGYVGTSMATPRVSAAVALLLSVHPGLSPDDVRARLTRTVTPYPTGSTCTVVRCGAGIVNAGNLLATTKRFVHATHATISGTAKVGRTLTVHPGAWHPGATRLSYRWYRDGHALAATGSHYRVRAADRGARLTVMVTATRTGYAKAVARSLARGVARYPDAIASAVVRPGT